MASSILWLGHKLQTCGSRGLEITKNTDGKYIIPKEQVGSFKLLGSAEDNVDVVETVVDLIK